jgi:hypothetical protein
VAKVAHTMVICAQAKKERKKKKRKLFEPKVVEPKPFWSALTFKG